MKKTILGKVKKENFVENFVEKKEKIKHKI